MRGEKFGRPAKGEGKKTRKSVQKRQPLATTRTILGSGSEKEKNYNYVRRKGHWRRGRKKKEIRRKGKRGTRENLGLSCATRGMFEAILKKRPHKAAAEEGKVHRLETLALGGGRGYGKNKEPSLGRGKKGRHLVREKGGKNEICRKKIIGKMRPRIAIIGGYARRHAAVKEPTCSPKREKRKERCRSRLGLEVRGKWAKGHTCDCRIPSIRKTGALEKDSSTGEILRGRVPP